MSDNDAVAALLFEFADLLEAKGVEYKPRAYRRAAENVRDHPESVLSLAADGPDAVAEIDRVGDAIASKIVEYAETGSIEELDELRSELPVEMDALTRVEGVGPKTVGTLYEELGVRTLDDLEAAAEAGEIREIKGFGEKTEQNILDGIDFARTAHDRSPLDAAVPRGEAVRDYLRSVEAVATCELAGSIRRWKPTVGDVDVLAASEEAPAVVEAFTEWPDAETVIEAGTGKASVRSGGVRVDLRVVAPAEFGAALQYFTGSWDHNVALRNRAIERGLTMNEYGVFRRVDDDGSTPGDPDTSGEKQDARSEPDASGDRPGPNEPEQTGERIAGDTEAEMYEAIDLPWIPPELREGRGEIDAADSGDLPDLVGVEDVRGDLHVHTNWSDGGASIAEMIEAAAAFGHEYVCITDHATGPGMVGGVGLDDARIREQLADIRTVAETADIDVLAGIEANIAGDGSISIGDDVAADLDCVIASPHAGLDGDGTERLVAAAKHPAVDILGHPTGRRINERPGLDVDVERLARVAAEHDTALEVNADPRRLDLDGLAVATAVDAGAQIVVNTDAHGTGSYPLLRYGVHTARRGWAEPGDVVNARGADDIRAFLE